MWDAARIRMRLDPTFTEGIVDLQHWLTTFRELHEKARNGALAGAEVRDYQERRRELAHAMLAAQDLTRPPGHAPRQSMRVARALQVELQTSSGRERLTTFDISVGGFSAPMASAPVLGASLAATVRLPGGVDPLQATVKVVGAQAQSGSVRVSFSFAKLEGADAERLEFALIDMVLAQFK
jgi:hypothetical protein